MPLPAAAATKADARQRRRGSVASRTTCTVVVAGLASRKYSALPGGIARIGNPHLPPDRDFFCLRTTTEFRSDVSYLTPIRARPRLFLTLVDGPDCPSKAFSVSSGLGCKANLKKCTLRMEIENGQLA